MSGCLGLGRPIGLRGSTGLHGQSWPGKDRRLRLEGTISPAGECSNKDGWHFDSSTDNFTTDGTPGGLMHDAKPHGGCGSGVPRRPPTAELREGNLVGTGRLARSPQEAMYDSPRTEPPASGSSERGGSYLSGDVWPPRDAHTTVVLFRGTCSDGRSSTSFAYACWCVARGGIDLNRTDSGRGNVFRG